MKTTPWQTLTAAPHRVMFLGGTAQFVLALLLWGAELGARHGLPWPPLPLTLAPLVLHATLMLYGLFPFFIFGFLMTTFPRWMRGKEDGCGSPRESACGFSCCRC